MDEVYYTSITFSSTLDCCVIVPEVSKDLVHYSYGKGKVRGRKAQRDTIIYAPLVVK